jgi:hypothetical protein
MTHPSQVHTNDAAVGGGFNLVAWARPYFGLIALTAILLSALGVYSMTRMPSNIYPEAAFPRVVIIARSTGLAVKDVEITVTRPIEEAASIVLKVVRIRSKSIRGASELSIDFAPGADMVQALDDVRARLAEVISRLPPGTTTLAERQTPSVFPIISFAVTGGKNPSELYDYAYFDLRPRVTSIPDVSYVTVQGGDVREIVVEVEPEALAAAGLPDGSGMEPQGALPALALTGYRMVEDIRGNREAGSTAHPTKRIDFAKPEDMVCQVAPTVPEASASLLTGATRTGRTGPTIRRHRRAGP